MRTSASLSPRVAYAAAVTSPAASRRPSTFFLSCALSNEVPSCTTCPTNRTSSPLLHVSRRGGLSAALAASVAILLPAGNGGFGGAAILEADDDVELLERVKQDRKKRIERQGIISSSDKEKGYLQEVVYKLSKVGQAIESNDLPTARTVLGPSINVDWIQNVNKAFNKLSSSPDEKVEVDLFNNSLASLFLSVGKQDIESSKLAFVSSASALEKWVALSGLVSQLKGL